MLTNTNLTLAYPFRLSNGRTRQQWQSPFHGSTNLHSVLGIGLVPIEEVFQIQHHLFPSIF